MTTTFPRLVSTSMRAPLALALHGLAWLGCAAPQAAQIADAHPPATVAAHEGGADFASQRARELPNLPLVDVVSPDGSVSLQLEAAGRPRAARSNGVLQMEIPIGTASPILCFLYDASPPPGGVLAKVFSSGLDKWRDRTIDAIDAGVVDGKPFIFAEALYQTTRDGAEVAGALRAIAFDVDERTFACLHDEPGYTATFRRIVTGAVHSLTKPADSQAVLPKHAQVLLTRVGGHPIGYVKSSYTVRGDGKSLEKTVSSMFAAPGGKALTVGNAVRLSVGDASGNVETIVAQEDDGSTITTNLSVTHETDGSYVVSGLHDGRKVDGRFKVPTPLRTEEVQRRETKAKLLGGTAGNPLTFLIYDDDVDPLAATKRVVRATNERFVLEHESGTVTARVRVDEDGLEKSVMTTVGGEEMALERVSIETASH